MGVLKNIQHVMDQAVENCEVAGVNLLVKKDGKELYYAQAGMADIEKNRSMERDTILRLYSQTKPVTALAAMILMERGEIDLCQPVSDFIPAFESVRVLSGNVPVPCDVPVRVCDLLRMTSGLVYPEENSIAGLMTDRVFSEAVSRIGTDQEMTTMELANRLAECPLAFVPGTSWHYGTSADALGAVIETVTGMRFGEFLKKELFDPLDMKDTAFWVPADKQHRLAAAYDTVKGEDGSRNLERFEGNHLAICNDMSHDPAYEAGGAGLVSTLDDYMRLAQMLLGEGELEGVRILKPRTVKFFTGGKLQRRQQKAMETWLGLEGYTYSNLMRVCDKPSRSSLLTQKGEYGWDGWLGVYFANFPKENMTFLMGTQKKDAGTFALTRKLRNLVLGELGTQ